MGKQKVNKTNKTNTANKTNKTNKSDKNTKTKLKAVKNEKLITRMRAFLIAAMAVIIFYPPYLQGLFFEKHVLPTGIFVFAVFIIFLVYKWLKKDFAFLKTPIEYIALAFVAVYFISIFNAVHTRSAIIEWLKYCMYFAVFYMITELANDLKTKLLFLWTIIVSAVGVSIIGLDSANGGKFVGVLNKVFNIFGYKGDMFFGLFVSNRINSTLQYPNALASYVMAVFFLTIGMLMVQKKWWQKAITGACSFILFVTFVLTQSRGAQLLFPIALAIFFLVMPKGNRIKAVTHVLLFVIPAIAISYMITPYLSVDILNIKALGILTAGIILSGLIGIISKYIGSAMQKINWIVYVGLIAISAVLVIAGGIHVINASVPVELKHEITAENRTQSVAKDVALEPNKEYILTYEVEAWMEEEKSYAYFVRLFSKNERNILFGGSPQLLRENLQATNGVEERSIKFTTPEDSKLISIYFSNYYAGTGIKVNNVKVLDAETNEVIKKVSFKNKYNLDKIINRFQNIWLQNSLLTRAIFYKDGFEIFRDRWFFGGGGGAWNNLYRQYQSYNYASSQAHNFPLQLGIETGTIGLLILLCLIIILIHLYTRYYKKEKQYNYQEKRINDEDTKLSEGFLNASIITAIAALLMHSIIDFDFSEASMLLLFWQLIAFFGSNMREKLMLQEMLPFKIIKNNTVRKNKINAEGKAGVITGIALSVIALGFSFSFYMASSFAQKSYEYLRGQDIQKAITSINKAISFDKFNEKYILGYNPIPSRQDIKTGLADLLFIKNSLFQEKEQKGEKITENEQLEIQQEFASVNKRINDLEKEADNNLNLSSNIASYYFKTGQTEKGLKHLDSAIKQFPFEPALWHSKVDVYFQLMGTHFNNGEHDTAKEYINSGLNIIDEATEVNKRNMNPFIFKEETVALLQKMQFMNDYWDQDEISDINKIVHYSIFDLDVNMDGMPDQWSIADAELVNASITEDNLEIKAIERSLIYSQHYIKLEKGKTYQIEVKLKDSVEYLSYYIVGITPKILPLARDNGKYLAGLLVEDEPYENGNQFRVYLEENCILESIVVKEKYN
jgi:O-antigen ligase